MPWLIPVRLPGTAAACLVLCCCARAAVGESHEKEPPTLRRLQEGRAKHQRTSAAKIPTEERVSNVLEVKLDYEGCCTSRQTAQLAAKWRSLLGGPLEGDIRPVADDEIRVTAHHDRVTVVRDWLLRQEGCKSVKYQGVEEEHRKRRLETEKEHKRRLQEKYAEMGVKHEL